MKNLLRGGSVPQCLCVRESCLYVALHVCVCLCVSVHVYVCYILACVCVCARLYGCTHTHTHTSVLKRQQQHRQHRNQHIPWRFLRPTRKFSSVENYRQWLRKGRSLFAGFSLNYIRVYYAACSKFFTIANNSINIWYCDCRTHPAAAAAAASHHRLKILHPRRVRAPVIIADTFTSAVWYILNKNTKILNKIQIQLDTAQPRLLLQFYQYTIQYCVSA